ncbi:hypothetical protein F5148DRAFT_1172483 [Russula earlei]|uniref:Uncharacterized protein n=1 Tax=Russula earlei TaxID=71964 RepID=A0ACC0UI87_9AGAM|nr:hypothetical protein F5148DRAFT_1172483 [Russula earlei]
MQLYAFVFDATFRTLQGQGSAISLAPWYNIHRLSSVCGSDEVVLVNSNAQVRIFSFVTQQLRPASLQLPLLPSAMYPSHPRPHVHPRPRVQPPPPMAKTSSPRPPDDNSITTHALPSVADTTSSPTAPTRDRKAKHARHTADNTLLHFDPSTPTTHHADSSTTTIITAAATMTAMATATTTTVKLPDAHHHLDCLASQHLDSPSRLVFLSSYAYLSYTLSLSFYLYINT